MVYCARVVRMSSVVDAHRFFQTCHPELVSGSISPHRASVPVVEWMLKQVQHDVKESLSRA